MRSFFKWAMVGVLLPGVFAFAAGPDAAWTLTTADFQHQVVGLLDIGADGVHVSASAGTGTSVVPLDRFVSLNRTTPAPAKSAFVLCLAGGDRMPGEPAALKDEQLHWTSASLGDVLLPLSDLRAIVRGDRLDDKVDAVRREDSVVMANGDTARGIVTVLADGKVTIKSAEGAVSDIPLANVAGIYFASASRKPSTVPVAASFRVGLADGSVFRARSLATSEGTANLSLSDGAQRRVPVATLVSVEQLDGPITWLSTVAPAEAVHTPYLELSFPARMDRAVGGDVIRFGKETFARGIGVHSYSRLTWNLDGSQKAFRTQYAIDGDRPSADVTVRIQLDGKTVHEQKGVRSGSISPVVQIGLAGAKTLTLEADYGANYGFGDRLNWIEPALLRQQPSTMPSTQP